MLRLIIFLSLFSPSVSFAQGDGCPNWVGMMVLRAAWISPEFSYCEFERFEPLADGEFVALIKVTGQSRITLLDDTMIWVRAAVHIDTSPVEIIGVEWRDYKALVPPSEGWKVTAEILNQIGAK